MQGATTTSMPPIDGHIPPLDESGEYIESVLFMYVAKRRKMCGPNRL